MASPRRTVGRLRGRKSLRGALLIYGSTGFTGRLIAEKARDAGLNLVIAGRDVERLRHQAALLGVPWRVVTLDEPSRLGAALRGVGVVLNAAGPFAVTAAPLVEACLRSGCHYLDVSGELPTFQSTWRRHGQAVQTGIMLMPGAGWAVVASDCAAARAASLLPDAKYLRLGLSMSTTFSRGSLRAAFGLASSRVTIRRDRRMISVPAGRLEREFDFGDGSRWGTALNWPDVCTAYYTTGIPNVEVYVEADAWARIAVQISAPFADILRLPPSQSLLSICAGVLPEGPSVAARRLVRHIIIAEAEDGWRRRRRVRVETIDGYSFTAISAVAIAGKVLQGEFEMGFQTPTRVYGPDLLSMTEGTVVESDPAIEELPALARQEELAKNRAPYRRNHATRSVSAGGGK